MGRRPGWQRDGYRCGQGDIALLLRFKGDNWQFMLCYTRILLWAGKAGDLYSVSRALLKSDNEHV